MRVCIFSNHSKLCKSASHWTVPWLLSGQVMCSNVNICPNLLRRGGSSSETSAFLWCSVSLIGAVTEIQNKLSPNCPGVVCVCDFVDHIYLCMRLNSYLLQKMYVFMCKTVIDYVIWLHHTRTHPMYTHLHSQSEVIEISKWDHYCRGL